jgi:RNA recognition motif-containing protein
MNTVVAALIVDGFPLSWTSEHLTEMFAAFGKVTWARVVMDRFRRSLSYGYVVMDVDADATKAVEALDGKDIGGGQKLKVVYAPVPPLPRK